MNANDRLRHMVAFFGCSVFAAILPIALLAIAVLYLTTRHVVFPASIAIQLPGDRGTLTYTRIGVHLFQPEWSRTVSLNGQHKHPLVIDTGHGTDVNLFWIENGDECFVRMQDHCGEYLLDINSNRSYLMITVTPEHAFVLPLLTESPSVIVTRLAPDQDPSTARVRIERERAVPVSDLVSDHSGEYMGVIIAGGGALRFQKSSERQLRPIPTRTWGAPDW